MAISPDVPETKADEIIEGLKVSKYEHKIQGNHDFVVSGGCLKGVKCSINPLVDGLSSGDIINDKRTR